MRQGFSLVELSIVLVILGLLTGGILAGQSLIRASELRSITSDLQRYHAAANTFRDKYFAIPGDMTNAQNFWGTAHATPATCVTTPGTGTQTCNGDGDGNIEYNAAGSNEGFRYWQHLANAGLIEGTYTGTEGSVGNAVHSIPGTNVPRSKMGNAGPSWYYYASPPANTFAGTSGNLMLFGNPTAVSITNSPFIKAEESWNLDTKIDDGRPAHGKWRSYTSAARAACASSAASDAEYVLSSTTNGCDIIWMPGY